MTLNEFTHKLSGLPETPLMPALFVGHGSPLNGVEDNVYSRGWATLGQSLPHPKAILAISAHWLTEGTYVHVAKVPRTIHDFSGFPKELYDLTYPTQGAPECAQMTKELITSARVLSDNDWGIDHGTWIVLHHMYPYADIPTFQLSIDMSKPSQFHYELGRELSALRKKGVLIMGSGNIVHNLGRIDFNENAPTFDWAGTFDEKVKTLVQNGDHSALIHYEKLGGDAMLAVPTPDHYWPLLYILGLQQNNEEITFPIEGMTHGSISMRSIQIG